MSNHFRPVGYDLLVSSIEFGFNHKLNTTRPSQFYGQELETVIATNLTIQYCKLVSKFSLKRFARLFLV